MSIYDIYMVIIDDTESKKKSLFKQLFIFYQEHAKKMIASTYKN